jgi:hypothetical protein
MDPTTLMDTFYNVRNAILCLGFLLGIGGGIFLIIRKRKLAGILAIVGFLFLSLEPISDFVIFRILYRELDYSEELFNKLDLAYPIISAPAIFLGSIALIIALVSTVLSKHKPGVDQPEVPSLEK